MATTPNVYVRRFDDLRLEDAPETAVENASLGEMIHALGACGVRVPDGFALTARAWRQTLAANGLERVVRDELGGLAPGDGADLQRRGERVRRAIRAARLPDPVVDAIRDAYRALSTAVPGGVAVAVRSSATAEGLPEARFARQQDSYLDVRGEADLLDAVSRCYASLYSDRAIAYRTERGYDPLAVGLSVGVQRVVRSDVASAGVVCTRDPESGRRDVALVTASWGLGELVVQGRVEPDEYLVFKPTLATGHRPILQRALGAKELRLVYDAGGDRRVRTESVASVDRDRFALSDDEVLELARLACAIEAHYAARRGTPTPMDIEWAKDGRTGQLFIVQACPEMVDARAGGRVIERCHERASATVVTHGRAVGDHVATGRARVVHDPSRLGDFRDGDVLVAARTDPDWEPIMRRASAVVTDHGGRACHAAIVSRELGVPAIVGTGDATARLHDGAIYTVSCAHGDDGRVYAGTVPFDVERIDVARALRMPHEPMTLNVGAPAEALRLGELPSDGVGFVCEDLVIASAIGIHPLALLDFARLDDELLAAAIAQRTPGWANKAEVFLQALTEGIAQIAAAFHPRPVTLRFSDFASAEYRGLLGGERYEPTEANPASGCPGALRCRTPAYRRAFGLECAALKKVRETMGLTNVRVMVPLCRTFAEARAVLGELAEHGLVRGEAGLEVLVATEAPQNAALAERIAQLFDRSSIGDDSTQLTLGAFDERDPGAHVAAPLREAHACFVVEAARVP